MWVLYYIGNIRQGELRTGGEIQIPRPGEALVPLRRANIKNVGKHNSI